MKKVLKFIKVVFLVVSILLLMGFIFLYLKSPGKTTSFKTKNGISEMSYVKIGGIEQFLLIRGKDKNNPILLLLHGGPGASETPMFRNFNSSLEEHYTVIYWDQRGAGKTIINNERGSNFLIDTFVEDINELTNYLKKRFKKDKIFLLGHSWGSLIGIKAVNKYPDNFYAFVGTGQFSNSPKNEELAYSFAKEKVHFHKDTHGIEALDKIGSFSNKMINKEYIIARLYVSKYGSLYEKNNPLNIFVYPILNFKEYTLKEKFKTLNKSSDISEVFNSPMFNMFETIFKTDLTEGITNFKVPIYILQGKHDYLTNYSLAKKYFDSIRAPIKHFIPFEKSGHFPQFEESNKFNNYMINEVLKNHKQKTD